jgi:citrate synthase
MILLEKFEAIVPGLRDRVKKISQELGDKVISEVTVNQALGGMRGVKSLVCETSYVDPQKGLIIRGKPLSEVSDRLPEEILFLLLTGSLPEGDEITTLKKDFADRMEVPGYVWDMLRGMDSETHPMTMFSAGILAMQRESEFAKAYSEGISKKDYWKPCVEDTVTLLARLPGLAAGIYRIRFNKGELIDPDPNLDLGANFAHMTGLDDPDGEFKNLMRLYFTLHCDHEGGNVSAFATHVVGSALSDAYYSLSAGLNGLAGPLHGLANQECLKFVQGIVNKVDGAPNKEQVKEYVWDTLNDGKVIPGYGHAVLRATDPRFKAFHEFGQEHFPEDPEFKTVALMFEVVPDILKEHGKAKSPWPNVDAASGSLLYHYGLTEYNFYTVLFGVSRAMGVLSQLIINRAIGTPITRPKSVTLDWIEENAG